MPADRYDAMFLGEAIVIITAFIYGIYLMKMNNFNGESSLYSVID